MSIPHRQIAFADDLLSYLVYTVFEFAVGMLK